MTQREPEQLIIRPPSEHRSLLIRATRGCKWNKCKFCGIYPIMGQPDYSARRVDDIKHDIDILRARHTNMTRAFIGDADPITIGLENFVEIMKHLRTTFPELTRVTCYSRASTVWKLKQDGIRQLADSGLDRIHIGLESGDSEVLKIQHKGLSPEVARDSGIWLRNAGIELSWYILLGMGGRDLWKQHAQNTARIIDDTSPDFIRMRRLWIYGDGSGRGPESPLWKLIKEGSFIPQTPEGTVLELKEIITGIEKSRSSLFCDHANNYYRINGRLPDEKQEMLNEIDTFLSQPEEVREAHYRSMSPVI